MDFLQFVLNSLSLRYDILGVILFATVFSLETELEPNFRIVNTTQGRIRGECFRGDSVYIKHVCEFLGIPFAKPPIGTLRFRHPEPLDVNHFGGIYNANKMPNSCYQSLDTTFGGSPASSMWNPKTNLSEDCLYLNIWAPGGSKKKAVMVWIYGGSFIGGSIARDMFNGRFLSSRTDVIVVTIAYRVGPFGFLYLNHSSAPGNAGLFDQLFGLKWVQQNIDSFGGDSGNITLFGNSAGGLSVGLHLLSPYSTHLFNRAILQSGTPLIRERILTSSEAKRRSLNIAVSVMGCTQSDGNIEQILECMKTFRPDVIQNALSKTNLPSSEWTLFPTIDEDFVPSHPSDLLAAGKFKQCPILIGSVLNEGTVFVIYSLPDYLNLTYSTMNRSQFSDSLQRLIDGHVFPGKTTKSIVRDAIAFQYTDWLNPEDSNANLAALGLMAGDVFICPTIEFADAYISAGQKVYKYQLTERYNASPWPEWMGVVHGDEIFFVFGAAPAPGLELSDEDVKLSRTIMSYWTSFAKTGNPNEILIKNVTTLGEWPTYNTKRQYLELNSRHIGDRSSQAIGKNRRAKECAFWKYFIPRLEKAYSPEAKNSASPIHITSSEMVVKVLFGLLAGVVCFVW